MKGFVLVLLALSACLSVAVATSGSEKFYFAKNPLALVGDFYLFGTPEKTSIPLEGFYVSGVTGAVESRKSKVRLTTDEPSIPATVFDSTTLLQAGN